MAPKDRSRRRRGPEIPRIDPGSSSGRAGNAYDRIVINTGDDRSEKTARPGRTKAGRRPRPGSRRYMSVELAEAIQQAKEGDDTALLPYQPTPSINPPRPRTLAAGYDYQSRTLRIRFRNGQVYGYYNVPPNIWATFHRVKSPGRFINRTLNFYPYAPEHDLDIDTGMR